MERSTRSHAKQFAARALSLLLGAAVLSACGAMAPAPPAESIAATIDEAFVYALPVFEMARARYAGTAARPADKSALNRLMHRRTLSTAENRTVTTPNNDTLYSQAFLELSGSPVEINTPDFGDRYFSIAFMDVFTNNFAVVGRRTTGTKPQHYYVVGPDWQGSAPAGATLIRAPGNWVWVLVRILVQGPEELPQVQRLQDEISLRRSRRPHRSRRSRMTRQVSSPSSIRRSIAIRRRAPTAPSSSAFAASASAPV